MSHSISADDQSFQRDVESCAFPVSEFNHRAHLRLAYIYLVQGDDVEWAIGKMRETLLKLLMFAGIDPSQKYHETMTRAWLMIVHQFMNSGVEANSADQFLNGNKSLMGADTLYQYYSEDRLYSQHARQEFLKPDIKPLPNA